MALELLLAGAARPASTGRAIRVLQRFRATREELRRLVQPSRPLEALQYEEPARRLGADPDEIRTVVEEWIHRRPLRHLARCRRPDLLPALDRLVERGVAIGVFSDYPAVAKLEILGLGGRMEVALAATDPEVNAFKPHPAGFLEGVRRFGLAPGEVLYVGDRIDVDRDAALAAGLRAALVGTSVHAFPRFASLLAAHGLG